MGFQNKYALNLPSLDFIHHHLKAATISEIKISLRFSNLILAVNGGNARPSWNLLGFYNDPRRYISLSVELILALSLTRQRVTLPRRPSSQHSLPA